MCLPIPPSTAQAAAFESGDDVIDEIYANPVIWSCSGYARRDDDRPQECSFGSTCWAKTSTIC